MTIEPAWSETVARYLSQASVVEDPQVRPSPISRQYELNFQSILRGLGIEEPEWPRLFVAHTPQARVESLRIGEEEVIVYDQHLGQTFNRLNDFAYAAWPPDYVTRWGFKHLAFALAQMNQSQAAAMALGLFQLWPVPDSPREASAAQLPYRGLITAMQEYFILAHECVHFALRSPSISIARSEFDDLIDGVVTARISLDVDIEEIHARILEDELRVLSANRIDTDDEEFTARLAERVAQMSLPDLPDTLAKHEHMREELICDLIATELTMSFFHENGSNAKLVLAAILQAFHNLTSREVIRSHALAQAGLDANEGLDRIGLRKSFWRDLMVSITPSSGGEESELDELFENVTNVHARTVGDQIIYILPFEFDRAMERIDSDAFGAAEAERVIQTIREMIDLQRTGPIGDQR